MKSDDIKRSFRANRHDRAVGDPPSLGSVRRMPGTGLPKIKVSRRKEGSGEGTRKNLQSRGRQRAVFVWTSLFAGLTLMLVTTVAWIWVLPKMAEGEKIASQTPSVIESPPPLSFTFPSPSERDALALVKQALAIRDPAEVSGFFRLCDTSPAGIIAFLSGLMSSDGEPYGFEWLSNLDSKDIPVEGVLVKFTNNSKARDRLALLTPDVVGKWKIDFDALARTVRPTWKELIEEAAPSGLVRVSIVKDTYYNGAFENEAHWVCYGMASPDTEFVMLGYCKVGSPQAAAMEWIFSNEDSLNRVTLEIRRVKGAESRQFEISRVHAADWIVGSISFDEGFK